jgi:hypothetical protein
MEEEGVQVRGIWRGIEVAGRVIGVIGSIWQTGALWRS